MQSRLPRWAALGGAVALSLAAIVPQGVAAQVAPGTGAGCSIATGFYPLNGQIFLAQGANIVGDCTQNPYSETISWNVLQPTTGGLLYLRSCDNTTAFTDGTQTWLLGPNELQSRLNTDQPFDWECVPGRSVAPQAAPPAMATPAPAPATPTPPAPTPSPVQAPPPPPMPARVTCLDPTISVRNTDLSFLNRSGVNYLCADMYHAKLTGTDFSGAYLVQANLQAAELTRANFYGARLTLAVLWMTFSNSSKQVPGPNFGGADLKGARISTSKLPYSDFRYADLSNADLSRSVLTGSDLRGADLRAADLSQTDFTDANLTGAYLCGANTTGTIFLRAVGVSTSCS
jgi:hypothetical protein